MAGVLLTTFKFCLVKFVYVLLLWLFVLVVV